ILDRDVGIFLHEGLDHGLAVVILEDSRICDKRQRFGIGHGGISRQQDACHQCSPELAHSCTSSICASGPDAFREHLGSSRVTFRLPNLNLALEKARTASGTGAPAIRSAMISAERGAPLSPQWLWPKLSQALDRCGTRSTTGRLSGREGRSPAQRSKFSPIRSLPNNLRALRARASARRQLGGVSASVSSTVPDTCNPSSIEVAPKPRDAFMTL